MTYLDKKTGKSIQLVKGDVIELKDGTIGTITQTNDKIKIIGGTAIIKDENNAHRVITQNDVNEVLDLVFTFIRFIKKLFGNGKTTYFF